MGFRDRSRFGGPLPLVTEHRTPTIIDIQNQISMALADGVSAREVSASVCCDADKTLELMISMCAEVLIVPCSVALVQNRPVYDLDTKFRRPV